MLLEINELEKEIKTKEEMLEVLKQKIEVLNALKNEKSFIDDHTGNERDLDAIVEFKSNYRELGIFHYNSNFCINKAYVGNDGKIHLSQYSIGPVIDTRGSRSLEDIIEEFNKENGKFGKQITKLYYPDGRIEVYDV